MNTEDLTTNELRAVIGGLLLLKRTAEPDPDAVANATGMSANKSAFYAAAVLGALEVESLTAFAIVDALRTSN